MKIKPSVPLLREIDLVLGLGDFGLYNENGQVHS